MNPRVRDGLTWIVACGWLANLVAGMVPPLHYTPSLVANAPLLLILGAMYAVGKRDKDDR